MITVKSFTVSRLKKEFLRGAFAVPLLQRQFVWTRAKSCQLLESIYRGLPIGTVLLWQAGLSQQFLLRKDMNILPPFNSELNDEILFILDGQQRLSVIWRLLELSGAAVTNYFGQEIRFDAIHADVGAAGDVVRFAYRATAIPRHYVQVQAILAHDYRRRLAGLPKLLFNRALRVRKRLLDYSIYSVNLQHRRLDDVRDAFVRINGQGTPLRAADRAFARVTKFDLRKEVVQQREVLSSGYSSISDDTLLSLVSIAWGHRDLGEKGIDKLTRDLNRDQGAVDRFRKEWPVILNALKRAIDYMAGRYSVRTYDELPSDNMLLVLAYYFYCGNGKQPTAYAKKKLDQWFWTCIVTSRYSGAGWRKNMVPDLVIVEGLALKRRSRFKVSAPAQLQVLLKERYAAPRMLPLGFFCLLRLMTPKYLNNAQPIPMQDPASLSNRHDRHHIFPQQLMANQGVGASEYNLLMNVCILPAEENQSIGSRRPCSYLTEIAPSKKIRNEALRSHLIPFDTEAGLWKSNVVSGFRLFCRQRAALVAKELNKRAGTKIVQER